MNQIEEQLQEVNLVFDEGRTLKESARKSLSCLEDYLKAADSMERASSLSNKIASDATTDSVTVIQAKILSFYYSYERHQCLAKYYYEKHENEEARQNHVKSEELIKATTELAEKSLPILPGRLKVKFQDLLLGWKFNERFTIIEGMAIRARDDWDKGDFISALDLDRRMSNLLKDLIGYVRSNNLDPVYERIALGNYYGSIANASNALAGSILNKSSRDSSNAVGILSFTSAVELLRYTLEAYKWGKSAFQANPEWDQYLSLANLCRGNIQDLLQKNPLVWRDLYLEFEHDPEFLKVMKMTDLEKFKKIEAERHIGENKIAKLWSLGTFWILAFGAVGLFVLVVLNNTSWYQALLAFVAAEILFVILGAFILRTTGDLTEAGFLEVMELALKYQLQNLKLFQKREDKH